MEFPVALNWLCYDLKPSQSDINLLENLGQLDYNMFRPAIFTIQPPNPPIQCSLPILQMYCATNLRNDKMPCIYFANNWRLNRTLRYLQQIGVKGKFYQYVDCPSYLYPNERNNFINILSEYRCEFPIITGATKYKEDLENLGCVVTSVINNYDSKELDDLL